MAKTNATKKENGETLFNVDADKSSTGVVYRNVCRQIRALADAGDLDLDSRAGTIAQARSLAAVIDRASGLAGRKQETYALAGLHKQLAELLAQLTGELVASDDEQLAALLTGDDEP